MLSAAYTSYVSLLEAWPGIQPGNAFDCSDARRVTVSCQNPLKQLLQVSCSTHAHL